MTEEDREREYTDAWEPSEADRTTDSDSIPDRDADLLCRAAAEIADDAPLATRGVRPFLLAVSGWLDSCGDELARAGGNAAKCDEPGAIKSALTIARAYVGEN